MTKKTRKLKPVIGLVVAGLVSAAYAQCYFPHSGVCASTMQQVGTEDLSCNHSTPVYPKTDWWANDNLTGTLISGGIGRVRTTAKDACCGTATYFDCVTMQNVDLPNHCTFYDAPDTTANSCST